MDKRGEFKWFVIAFILMASAKIAWEILGRLSWPLLLFFFGFIALWISFVKATRWRKTPSYILISAGLIPFLSGISSEWITKAIEYALTNLTWEASDKWFFDILVVMKDLLLITNNWLWAGGLLLIMFGVYLGKESHVKEEKLRNSFLSDIRNKVDKALIKEGTIIDSDSDVDVTITVKKIRPPKSS